MKSNPKIIDISSDSSSDSTFDIPQIQRAYYYLGEGPSEFCPSPSLLEETEEADEALIDAKPSTYIDQGMVNKFK